MGAGAAALHKASAAEVKEAYGALSAEEQKKLAEALAKVDAKEAITGITVHWQLMSGEPKAAVISSAATLLFLKEQILAQLPPGMRISLIRCGDEQALPLQEEVGSRLTDGDLVQVVVRPNCLVLQQTDADTGLETSLEPGAGWIRERLYLGYVSACAIPPGPGWNVQPDLRIDFAVEATVSLENWPEPSWQGSIVSRHGTAAGWELRVGGGGVTALLTTAIARNRHDHNELMLEMNPDTYQWHHFCMFYEAKTSTLRLFRNGLESAEKRIHGTFLPYGRDVEVGRNPEWQDRGIVGSIYHAALWPEGFNLEDLPSMAAERLEEATKLEEADWLEPGHYPGPCCRPDPETDDDST